MPIDEPSPGIEIGPVAFAQAWLMELRGTPTFAEVHVGEAVTWKSESAKLPLGARPGPPLTRDGCASASSRTAVMPDGHKSSKG